MTSKYNNIKTTCTNNSTVPVLPKPTAKVIAQITGMSESYVKKVITGHSGDKSEAAQTIKYCKELIVDTQEVLVKAVTKKINKLKKQPSNI